MNYMHAIYTEIRNFNSIDQDKGNSSNNEIKNRNFTISKQLNNVLFAVYMDRPLEVDYTLFIQQIFGGASHQAVITYHLTIPFVNDETINKIEDFVAAYFTKFEQYTIKNRMRKSCTGNNIFESEFIGKIESEQDRVINLAKHDERVVANIIKKRLEEIEQTPEIFNNLDKKLPIPYIKFEQQTNRFRYRLIARDNELINLTLLEEVEKMNALICHIGQIAKYEAELRFKNTKVALENFENLEIL